MQKVLIVLILFFALQPSVFGAIKVKFQTIRPLEIQVLDASTKKPIPDIVVYYELVGYRPKNFLGIPLIDPIYSRSVRNEKLKTNKEGRVLIAGHTVWLNLYEGAENECIAINLDVGGDEKDQTDFSDGTSGEENETYFSFQLTKLIIRDVNKIITPLNTHKGVVLWNMSDTERRPGEEPAIETGFYKEIPNRGSLGKEKEFMVIELPVKAMSQDLNKVDKK